MNGVDRWLNRLLYFFIPVTFASTASLVVSLIMIATEGGNHVLGGLDWVLLGVAMVVGGAIGAKVAHEVASA